MQCSELGVSSRLDSRANLLTLSLMVLECDVVFLLNMLVTLARSPSDEPLRVELLLPLIPETCGGILDRSDRDIGSGSFVNGLGRMCDPPESLLVLGTGFSDIFDGF